MVKYTNKMSVPAEDPINVGEEFAPKISDPEEHAAPAPDIEFRRGWYRIRINGRLHKFHTKEEAQEALNEAE
jgi:hypothetical protein